MPITRIAGRAASAVLASLLAVPCLAQGTVAPPKPTAGPPAGPSVPATATQGPAKAGTPVSQPGATAPTGAAASLGMPGTAAAGAVPNAPAGGADSAAAAMAPRPSASALAGMAVRPKSVYRGPGRLPLNRYVASNPLPAGLPAWACKVDCVAKYETVRQVRGAEPADPLPPNSPTQWRRVPPQHVKRTRSVIEDQVFTVFDRSDRATHYRYGRSDGAKPVQ